MNSIIRFLIAAIMVAAAGWLSPLPAATSAQDARVKVSVELANPVVKTGESTTSYLKIGLIGKPEETQKRAPVNVALVIDRSGSMAGEKLEHAKQAAMMFVDRLSSEDILSVIAYDDVVEVVIPATKVTDREDLRTKIMSLQSRGSTALFAGVSKGAAEIRKFKDLDVACRMILLSDGLANVGPSSPEELAALGASLGSEGISIGTIGLGSDWNEDLMYKLATASDGAMAFAEKPSDLAAYFDREMRAVTHVVATNVEIDLTIHEPYKPVRVLGDRGTVRGNKVQFDLNQIYGDWENYFIVELAIPATPEESKADVASCIVSYRDLLSNTNQRVTDRAAVKYSSNPKETESSLNHEVLAQAVRLVAAENTMKAIKLRDQGQVDQAKQLLIQNAGYVYSNAATMPEQYQQELAPVAEKNMQQSRQLEDKDYNRTRKSMNTESQADMWQVRQ